VSARTSLPGPVKLKSGEVSKMKNSCLSLVISLSLLTCAARVADARQTAGAPAQPDERSQKFRRAVEKLGVGRKVTVILRKGRDQRGFVESVGDEGFQIVERKTQRVVAFKYAEVKRMRRGWRKPPGALEMGILGAGTVGLLVVTTLVAINQR
jgi:hypothetical protein